MSYDGFERIFYKDKYYCVYFSYGKDCIDETTHRLRKCPVCGQEIPWEDSIDTTNEEDVTIDEEGDK